MIDARPLEEKIYIPKSAEGKPNWETFNVLRYAEEKLLDNPAFIGIAALGSKVTGYSVSTSDIDVVILYDSSKRDSKLLTHNYKLDTQADFIELALTLEGKLRKEKQIKFSLFNLRDLNEQTIKEDLEAIGYSYALADMFRAVTGNKIKEYRTYWINKINNSSLYKRKKFIEETISYLLETDKVAFLYTGKVPFSRLPSIAGKEKEIIEARKKLWQNRLGHFGLQL